MVSGDQGNLPSYGKRDVGVAFDWKQHDWSEPARAQEVNTLVSNVDSYIGAQLQGPKPEDDTRSGTDSDSYSDASSEGLNASRKKNDARLDSCIDTQLWSLKPEDEIRFDAASMKPIPPVEEDDTRYVAYGAHSGTQLRNRKSSVMKDDTQSSIILSNRKKKEDRSLKTEESKTKGNMQVETDTGQTAYTLPSMTVPLPEEDRRAALLSVDHAVARQTEETSIESSLSMLQLGDTVNKLELPLQTGNGNRIV